MSEVTYIEEGDVYVCDNCGACSFSENTIDHYDSCRPGESKKWEKLHSEDDKKEVVPDDL